jgi:hypothetical protein
MAGEVAERRRLLGRRCCDSWRTPASHIASVISALLFLALLGKAMAEAPARNDLQMRTRWPSTAPCTRYEGIWVETRVNLVWRGDHGEVFQLRQTDGTQELRDDFPASRLVRLIGPRAFPVRIRLSCAPWNSWTQWDCGVDGCTVSVGREIAEPLTDSYMGPEGWIGQDGTATKDFLQIVEAPPDRVERAALTRLVRDILKELDSLLLAARAVGYSTRVTKAEKSVTSLLAEKQLRLLRIANHVEDPDNDGGPVGWSAEFAGALQLTCIHGQSSFVRRGDACYVTVRDSLRYTVSLRLGAKAEKRAHFTSDGEISATGDQISVKGAALSVR